MKKKLASPAKQPSPALEFMLAAWAGIPGGSYARLNHGMYSALHTAIASGMKFDEKDLAEVKGTGRWITDGGEGLYAMACGSQRGADNTSAAIALEHWLGRPCVLWAEETKSPERLYVGAKFTWQGTVVQVTSMSADKLVACTYKKEAERNAPEGTTIYFAGAYRSLKHSKTLPSGDVNIRLGAAAVREDTKIDRRFTITYADLAAARKAYDTRRKAYEKRFAEATTFEQVNAIGKEASAEGKQAYRHFDIELLRDAMKAATERIKKVASDIENAAERARQIERQAAEEKRLAETHDADLERWVLGETVHRLFNVVRVRIKDDYVETSTGHAVSVLSAKKLIPFVQIHRAAGWARADDGGPSADLHTVNRIDADGVKIGCTLFPWAEVDRLIPLLRKA